MQAKKIRNKYVKYLYVAKCIFNSSNVQIYVQLILIIYLKVYKKYFCAIVIHIRTYSFFQIRQREIYL